MNLINEQIRQTNNYAQIWGIFFSLILLKVLIDIERVLYRLKKHTHIFDHFDIFFSIKTNLWIQQSDEPKDWQWLG